MQPQFPVPFRQFFGGRKPTVCPNGGESPAAGLTRSYSKAKVNVILRREWPFQLRTEASIFLLDNTESLTNESRDVGFTTYRL